MYASNGVGGCITGEQRPGRVFSNSTLRFARICALVVVVTAAAVFTRGYGTDEGRGRVPLTNLSRSVSVFIITIIIISHRSLYGECSVYAHVA